MYINTCLEDPLCFRASKVPDHLDHAGDALGQPAAALAGGAAFRGDAAALRALLDGSRRADAKRLVNKEAIGLRDYKHNHISSHNNYPTIIHDTCFSNAV